MNTYCNEIITWLRIIVSALADGTTVVMAGVFIVIAE